MSSLDGKNKSIGNCSWYFRFMLLQTLHPLTQIFFFFAFTLSSSKTSIVHHQVISVTEAFNPKIASHGDFCLLCESLSHR